MLTVSELLLFLWQQEARFDLQYFSCFLLVCAFFCLFSLSFCFTASVFCTAVLASRIVALHASLMDLGLWIA